MRALSVAAVLNIAAITAQAGPIAAVDIFKPGGTVPIAVGAQTLQWKDGSDVSIGFTGSPNSIFLNLYQSTLKGLLDQNSQSISAAPGLGLAFSDPTAYEFSIVSRMEFQVSGSGGGTLYELVPNSGTLSIYLDGPGVGSAGVQADPTTGIGYDDGIEIFRAVPFNGSASLMGSVIVDELSLLTLVVRTDVLGTPVPIGDFHFSDTKQLSPAFLPQGFHIHGDDVLYADFIPAPPGDAVIDLINASAQFSTTIPEPATGLLLLLAGIMLFVRKRFFPSGRCAECECVSDRTPAPISCAARPPA